MVDLGNRIKTMRVKRGLSQKALAQKIGKGTTTISSYESNVQIPPTEVLESIAYALHAPIDYFFGIKCEKTYSDTSLTCLQREVLELLFKEFTAPSSTGEQLSDQQIKIIKRVILIFTGK